MAFFSARRRRIENELRRTRDDLRALNRDLEARTAELQATNKELEAFAYSISHDLRAPLRHTAGYAELLAKSAASSLDGKGRRYLTLILEAAKRMGNLIDDLLAFSRISRAEARMVVESGPTVAKLEAPRFISPFLTQLASRDLDGARAHLDGRGRSV